MRSISSSKMSGGKISHLYMWVQNNYSPTSDSTYYYFDEGGIEAKYFPSLPQPAPP